ncbi:MAG: hypothetical protein R2824_15840 [Saprospiraceae bacterium]
MASTATNAITSILSGANSSMVKLDDGSIVSLGQYQKLVNAANPGEEPQIAGILLGSDEGMVQLDDGRVISTAQFALEFQEAGVGEEPVIAQTLRGADEDTVQTANGLTSMGELLRVPPA